MKAKMGMILSVFVGLLLTFVMSLTAFFDLQTNLPLVLAIIGGSVGAVWAITNANDIAIRFKAVWRLGKSEKDQEG